ncbi:mevalonate kinase [Leucobacter sp. GX24907]
MSRIASPLLRETAACTQHDTRHGTGLAHAKAILFGEHAVVYGAPAIAVPLHGLEVQVEMHATPDAETRIESELFAGSAAAAPALMGPVVAAARAALEMTGDADEHVQLRIRSAIPHGRGLGSSAAVAAAVARAVADQHGVSLSSEALHRIVQRAESVAHGNPSGIDARAVAATGPIRFQSGEVSAVSVGAPLTFVIADSGASGCTAEAVAGVRDLRSFDPGLVDDLIEQLSELTEASLDDLAAGSAEALGARMVEAHRLLGRLGVSTVDLDVLVAAATGAGAYGAKLTGGGLGGCVLALAPSADDAERISLALRTAGAARTWTTAVPAV